MAGTRALESPAETKIGELAHQIGVGLLAGMLVGVIVGGVGGRLAMRISGIAAGPDLQGRITDAGFHVGQITVFGVVALLLLGVVGGMIGGTVFMAVRPWIGPLGRWSGLGFGALLLAIFGWAVIAPTNFDFQLFGPAALNVAMFAGLFLAFGLLIGPAVDRVERSARTAFLVEAAVLLTLLPAVLLLGMGLVGLTAALGGGATFPLPAVFAPALVVGAIVLRSFVRGAPSRSSYLLLGVPVILAGAVTIGGIVRILTPVFP